MVDGMWEGTLLDPVWWFAVAIVLTPLTAALQRKGGFNGGRSSEVMILSSCGAPIMCALMLPASHSTLGSGGAHHGSGAGLPVIAILALIHGVACLVAAGGVVREKNHRAMIFDLAPTGASMVAMGLSVMASA